MYRIRYGLGGGFGGYGDPEIIDAESLQDAENMAFEAARELYDSYGGMHGLFNEKDFLDENPDADDEDIQQAYLEDRENWIVYIAEKI